MTACAIHVQPYADAAIRLVFLVGGAFALAVAISCYLKIRSILI